MPETEDYTLDKQQVLHATIEGQNPYCPPGSILVGWVLLAEFVPPVGEKTLVKVSSEGLKGWEEMGYLHAGLEGTFGSDEENDGEAH